MRLRDRVDILRAKVTYDQYGEKATDWKNPVVVATVPAVVAYATVSRTISPGVNAYVEELRAVMPVSAFDASTDRLRWRGLVYTADGLPMVRRRNGVDHHQTVVLKRVS